MKREKEKCWTVLVQDTLEPRETFAVLLIRGDSEHEATTRAKAWWGVRGTIVAPEVSRTAWHFTALDAPIIKVSE